LHPFQLYCRLRKKSPTPFSAYFFWGDMFLLSSSPERFLKLTGKHVETRPIKGTRPRGLTHIEDEQLKNDLLSSEKDHAENIMIVDLLRNDLSRVCEPHSVQVPALCALESYAAVHHLVSVVQGTLKKEYTAVDLLKATFPGGSITGAPKIRAMELIAEIEPTARGPYCGSLGYIGFQGDMDCSIVIRTFGIKNKKITFQAGGAVTLDSDPAAEYEETLIKARALQLTLTESNSYDFVD
jgi:para-aminobenzoate synthetase component 1